MTPEQRIQRAQEAQRWLDDPLFKTARDDVYERIKLQRLAASTTDTVLHSKLILIEQVADQFFRYFEWLAQDGKFESEELEREARKQQTWKERLSAYVMMGRNQL